MCIVIGGPYDGQWHEVGGFQLELPVPEGFDYGGYQFIPHHYEYLKTSASEIETGVLAAIYHPLESLTKK